MFTNRIIWLAITLAFTLSVPSAGAQSGAGSGLYRIVSGSYNECCGIAGDLRSSLPNESQGFVRLTVDTQTEFATMTFLGKDLQTFFRVVRCPDGDPLNFSVDYGFSFGITRSAIRQSACESMAR